MSASLTQAETYTFSSLWGFGQGNGNGQYYGPSDNAIDSSNNVYVADRHNYRIQKFDGIGNFITKWSGPTSA